MEQLYYSVEQVADLLGLHVKTVRGYIRDGRLSATRIGKQYRIRREDLEEFGGGPVGPAEPEGPPSVEVSTVVRLEGVDREWADRVTTLVTAAAAGPPEGRARLHVQAVHDPRGRSLRLVILGDAAGTAALLDLVGRLT
ncbi:helix-turn-helix domain-containing protein [Nocardiopsis lambiniae]|uniref:Helix-turn-helix domain-containing protein n=1 Tax=Nocardiopsis lambiniae TaxID=3075539 RepID=A0ABU2MG90_9ACTN|nr:helix-turn-helix domain-containing protein [Nocardiopsis sp. DSM 44743]MDT0331555.1 helix-turn-helix domain-containing protein [Nocardiopsis sp. DSM 44743]